MLKGRASKARPSNTSPPKIGGDTPARKVGIALGCPRDYGGMPSGRPWSSGKTTVITPWTTRVIATPGAVATATATAEDGHELSADLYGGGGQGKPFSLMVVCHPRPPAKHPYTRRGEDSDPIGRHPTFPEVIDAGDLLAPGAVFHIVFVCVPNGVTRDPVELDGALGVQADQVGEAKTSPLLHTARA